MFTVALISEYLSEIWSEDEGRLRLRLCEEKNEEEEVNIIQSECCACQEAKYEVMFQVSRDDPLHYKDKCLIVVNYFQGLWSRETHPRDFPSSEWLLHFSDLIGASHDVNYRSLRFIKPKYFCHWAVIMSLFFNRPCSKNN